MKPSEQLKAKGWVPTRKDVHPQSTTWNKPAAGLKDYAFIDAVLYELKNEPGVIEALMTGSV